MLQIPMAYLRASSKFPLVSSHRTNIGTNPSCVVIMEWNAKNCMDTSMQTIATKLGLIMGGGDRHKFNIKVYIRYTAPDPLIKVSWPWLSTRYKAKKIQNLAWSSCIRYNIFSLSAYTDAIEVVPGIPYILPRLGTIPCIHYLDTWIALTFLPHS